MDFSDEPYVRKYTRKTLTSRLLGWEGRAVRDAMLDEFDAAGIFAIRGDAAACVSAVTEIPVELVRVALARLVETETWVVTPRAITWPTYEEAQNCMRSDRLRKRESRKARAAKSVTDVTTPVAAVTSVTAGHAQSQAVTPSHAESLSPPSFLPPSAPTHPERSSRVAGSVPAQGAEPGSLPLVLRTLPEDFVPSDELVANVVLTGLSKKRFLERLAELGDGPIGGARGVLPHKLESHLLKLATKWRDWDASDRGKGQESRHLNEPAGKLRARPVAEVLADWRRIEEDPELERKGQANRLARNAAEDAARSARKSAVQ